MESDHKTGADIGNTVLNGGVSMVVFFIVNKIVFREKAAESKK